MLILRGRGGRELPQVEQVRTSRIPDAPRAQPRASRPGRALSVAEPVELFPGTTAPPPVRPGTVPRPGLVNRLRGARRHRLVTLVAPAGYGKTTLLAQWAERDERPFAWVSLDEGDDAALLFSSVVAALRHVESIGEAVDEIGSPGRRLRSTGLPRLATVLSRVTQPIVLVLDGVEVVRSSPSAAVIATLVRHVPEGSTVVLAGRSLPELPIARLRAEGELFELGVDELALSRREARQLLHALHPDLDESCASTLWERTEGWAAGLHLAGLFVQGGGPGRRRPALELGGDDRFVSDYFGLEHFSRLELSELRFLMRTSVLDSMCDSLCDAVVGQERDSRPTLESLDRASMFVVPLDRQRIWYRYHHLFREALRAEVERREPDLVPMLYRRAAVWCEANGELDAARRYAAAAGDMNAVARLVASHALPECASGRAESLDNWLRGLADPLLLERNPGAAVVGGWIHALRGRTYSAALWLEAAERGSGDTSPDDGTTEIGGLVSLLRAAFCRDGENAMLADAETALHDLAWTSRWRPTALLLRAIGHLLRGETDRADRVLAETDELAAAIGATEVRRVALAERSLIATAAGDRPRARELVDAMGTLGAVGGRQYATSALELAALARIELRDGRWQSARVALEEARELVPTLTEALPWCGVQALLELARAHMALLDTSTAGRLLARAEAILERRPALGVMPAQAATLREELDALREQEGRRNSMLTPAELRLLPLLSTRLSFREIGEHLRVSRNTVKTQAIAVYRKLGVSSRNDAIDRAAELGLTHTGRS
jgi:LuxR family maltose regulon positive regulatory protein